MNQPGHSITATYQPVRAPRGNTPSCRGWRQEAALRMLMNSLDPDVAERPEELVPSGGVGKLARDWENFQAIVKALRALLDDETLLVQAGSPKGVLRSHSGVARILIAGADWSYVGTQGILPTTYELFSRAARKHFGGTLAGKLVVSGGMGGMGGAIPLAATANGGAFLGIDVDAERIKRRVKTGYCDLLVNSLDEALRILKNAVRKRETASVGLIGNCAELIPELGRRGVVPDLLTDQTPADEPEGYVLPGATLEQTRELRRSDPETAHQHGLDAIAAHVQGMLDLRRLGAVTFEYGNQIRATAYSRGVADAYDISDGVEEYLRPALRAGRGPLLWVALSGEAADIWRADKLMLDLCPADESIRKLLAVARRLPRFQGLPARACWLEGTRQAQFGLALNELVARGEVAGPMALISGFAGAIPEEPGGASGGEGASKWGILPESVLQKNSGAAWMRFDPRRRGDHDGLTLSWGAVADGTPDAGKRIAQVTGTPKTAG